VRIISLSPAYSGDDFVQESVYWISIKSTRYENPIKFNKPLTVTALRIKASAQLNGTIEQLNGVVSKRLKSYVFGTWLDNQISSNPADLFRHVLQSNANERPVKDEEIDLASLAEWHDYCRENGFEFNQIRDFSRSVEEVLRDIASSGRASVSSIDGKWSVIFDRPNPIVVQHFTPRNSKNFEATYSYFEMPHGFRVRFINEENNYLQDERVVYDDGYNETNATLFEGLEFPGVTKPSLIWKHGRYHIAQLRLRPATYTLQTDWEHLVCNRGDLVVVQHDVPQWGSGAARVKNVDEANQTVTLDDGMVMEIGKRYALRCRYQDGDSFIREVITNENEGYTLSLVGIGSLPNIGDLVMFGIYGQESKKMRVLSKEPLSDHEARLSLVAHAPEIMDADKGNIPEYVSGTPPRVNYWSYPPKNLSGYEVLSLDGTGVVSNLNIFWQPPAIGIPASYIVQIRKSPTEDYITQTISAPTTSTTFYSVPQGSYEVRVRAFFQYGQVSNWETINGVIVNKLYVPPPTVSNFSISVVGDTATLSWDKINDLAVAKYIIKFANVQNDASWANSVTLDGNLQSAPYQTTARGGAWLIKAVSVGGLESEEAAIVYSNVSGLTSFNAVETITENPSFSGNKTQSVAVDDDGHLRLISTDDIFAIQDIFSVQDIFLLGGIASAGIYNFANEIDLGEQYSVRLSSFITAYGQSTTTDIFAIQDIFSVQNIFNEEPSQWDVIIEYRYSTDAISPSTPWSAWSSISLSDVIGRSFQFRAVMYSKKYDITPVITNLGVQIDVPDRVVADNNILASPYGENVLFAKPFMKLQGLGINAENMATGDYYSVTNKTNHGFTIKFFNASGTGVSRRFDYIAKGYGVTT
jgi:hypothetical protein